MATIVAAAVTASVLAACAAPGTPAPWNGRALVLPAVPVTPRPGIIIDPGRIDDFACRRCARAGGSLGVEDLLFGELPLAAFEGLGAAERPGAVERAELLGDLVVSGYHGGRWLARELRSEGAEGRDGAGGPSSVVDRTAALALGDALFGGLATLLELTASEADAADPERAAGLVAVVAAVYGYNRGYLDLALERPPPGVAARPGAVVCPTPLDCRSDRFPVGGFDRWGGATAALTQPGESRWALAAAVLEGLLAASAAGGRQVWSGLLGASGFAPGSYRALIDASAGFLAVTGVTLRAAVTAWADQDPGAARVAFDLATGLLAWAGAYFLGLAAPAGGPAPALDCPS